MNQFNNLGSTVKTTAEKKEQRVRIDVRKAIVSDVNAIYKVAAIVGKGKKISEKGFLMDNYAVNPGLYKKKIRTWIQTLSYMYTASQGGEVVGFLMAFTKKEWLSDNPTWIEDISWKPGFEMMRKTDEFIVIDKTAIMDGQTGKGIGSILYKALMKDLTTAGIKNIFAETLIDPVPNFASLAFRKKQEYKLAGTRYEEYQNVIYTDLIYYKQVKNILRNYPQYIINAKQDTDHNN